MTQHCNKTDILCLQPFETVLVTSVCACVRACWKTHAEVSVPDLDGAVLTSGRHQLPITTVGAARGDDLLALHGPRLEHRLVLLFRVNVPRAHSPVKTGHEM